MEDTIHLEAYALALRKQKIYCMGDLNSLDKMFYELFNTYSDEVLRRSKVLFIFSDMYVKHTPKWLKNVYYDAIFRTKEAKDLQMAYNYIQHSTKPILIVWYSSEIPLVILQNIKVSKEDITLICGSSSTPKYEYTSLFFTTKTTYEELHSVLANRMKDMDIKSLLTETKASNVSLVWNGDDKNGSLYWIDLTPAPPTINYTQASEYLRTLADVLETKD